MCDDSLIERVLHVGHRLDVLSFGSRAMSTSPASRIIRSVSATKGGPGHASHQGVLRGGHGGREGLQERHMRHGDAPARLEHAGDIVPHLGLIRGEVEHAVGMVARAMSAHRSRTASRVASLSGGVSMGVSFRAEQGFWQLLNKGFDLVSHADIMAQGFLGALGRGGKPWRVVKATVDDPGAAGKNRTGFMGITINGHHLVEGQVLHSIEDFTW
jgi:hypothetical protein